MGRSKSGTRSLLVRELAADRQVPAPAARQVEGADRPGGAGARPLRRPGHQHRGARPDPGPQRRAARDPRNPGRQGLSGGRDADPAADPRRRQRPAVPHPHQRLRPRPVPAHRARAVPQAAVRRRRRAGLRAGPRLPQRGRRLQPQPRVHAAGGLPGARRLQRVDRRLPRADPERGAWPPTARTCSCVPATTARWSQVDISGEWPVKTVHGAVSEALGEQIGPDTDLAALRRLCDARGHPLPDPLGRRRGGARAVRAPGRGPHRGARPSTRTSRRRCRR